MAVDFDRCAELRDEELVALSSIYDDSFVQISESSFEVQLVCEDDSWWSMTIRIVLPPSYPQIEPPVYKVFGECLTDDDLSRIGNVMDEVWNEYKGECMLFVWIEKCKSILLERKDSCTQVNDESLTRQGERDGANYECMVSNELLPGEDASDKELESKSTGEVIKSYKQIEGITTKDVGHLDLDLPEVISGEAIVDRKSIFQGHVAYVETEEEVAKVVQKLKENRKIARASHNIMAYRLEGSRPNTFVHDCDDDGENEAGGRLLHLLQILNAKNIVVVVSRWYGGILLGPDRFKHINNCARDLIVNSGIFTEVKEDKATKSKKKSKKIR